MYHVPGDDDLLTVQKAVESARRKDTGLVGDNTDFAVLIMQVQIFTS